MDLDIDGNGALVTASSSGLGKASARSLSREGVNVLINGRDEDRLADTVDELQDGASGRVIGQAGDITDPDVIKALVGRTIDEFGQLDHLVTSAGGPPSGPFLETTEREWYQAYDLLVMSVVRLVHEAAEALRAGTGGTIVTITSVSVKEAIESLVLSNAVRSSVIGLEKTLAIELAPEVRANAVLPGTHETGRIRELIQQGIDRGDYGSYEEGLTDWSDGIPAGRVGNPQELGDVVAFLSSPRSGFVTGAAIPVDGGRSRSNL